MNFKRLLVLIGIMFLACCTSHNIPCENKQLHIYSVPWGLCTRVDINDLTIKQISATKKTIISESIPECDVGSLIGSSVAGSNDLRILLEYQCNRKNFLTISIYTNGTIMAINNKRYLAPEEFVSKVLKLLPPEQRDDYWRNWVKNKK